MKKTTEFWLRIGTAAAILFGLTSTAGCKDPMTSEELRRHNEQVLGSLHPEVRNKIARQIIDYNRRQEQKAGQEEQDFENLKQITFGSIKGGLLDSQLDFDDASTAKAIATGVTVYQRNKAIRESGKVNININETPMPLGIIHIGNNPYQIINENDWAYLLKAPDGGNYILKKQVLEKIREKQKTRKTSVYMRPNELPETFTCLDFSEKNNEILELNNVFTLRDIRNTKGVVTIVTKFYKSPLEWRCEILNSEKEIIDDGKGTIESIIGEGQSRYLSLLFKPEEYEKNPFGLRRYNFKFFEDGKEVPEKSALFHINYDQK